MRTMAVLLVALVGCGGAVEATPDAGRADEAGPVEILADAGSPEASSAADPEAGCVPLDARHACAVPMNGVPFACGVAYDGCGTGADHMLNCGTSDAGERCAIETGRHCNGSGTPVYCDSDCFLLNVPGTCTWISGLQHTWCCP